MALDITIHDPTGATLWTRSLPLGMIERWTEEDDDHPLAYGGAWHSMTPTPITAEDIERVENYALRSACGCAFCKTCREFSLELVQAARSAPPSSTIEAI